MSLKESINMKLYLDMVLKKNSHKDKWQESLVKYAQLREALILTLKCFNYIKKSSLMKGTFHC